MSYFVLPDTYSNRSIAFITPFPPPKIAGCTLLCRLPKIPPVSSVTGYAPVCVGSPRVPHPPSFSPTVLCDAPVVWESLRSTELRSTSPRWGATISNPQFFISLLEARQDPFRMIFPSLQHFRVDKYVSLFSYTSFRMKLRSLEKVSFLHLLIIDMSFCKTATPCNVSPGQPEQGIQDRTAWTGGSEHDTKKRTAGTGGLGRKAGTATVARWS
jgi:hypothetical protein